MHKEHLPTWVTVLIVAVITLLLLAASGCGDQPNCQWECHIDSPDVEPDLVCWKQDIVDAFGNVWLETCCLDTEAPTQPPSCFIS